MRKIKSFKVFLGVFVLIAFSLLLFLNLMSKDIASAQTCQEHKVVCDDGKVPCCEKFKPHCKDGEPKCCKKKKDGSLKCHDKEGNIYPVECKESCDENVTEEDETVVESEVLSEQTIDQQSTETIETTTRALIIGAPGCLLDTPDCNIVGPGIPNNMCGYCYSSTACRLVDVGAGDFGRRDTSAKARYFSACAYTAFQGNPFVPFCPQSNYNPGDCTCNCGPPTIPSWGNVGCGTGAYCRIDSKCGRECGVDSDCAVSLKGKKCSAGRCGCSGIADCSAGQTCFSGICVGCLLDTEPGGYDPLTKCFPGKLCRASDHKCVNCLSNTDCSSTLVCDTTSTSPTYGSCVQCLVDSHCVSNPNGTNCDPLDHLCKRCYISGGTTYGCSSSTPTCNPLTNTCVFCTTANGPATPANPHLGCSTSTPVCVGGSSCVQCTTANSSACTGSTPICKPSNLLINTCVGCLDSSYCSSIGSLTPVCDPLNFRCRGCQADSECTSSFSGYACKLSNGQCVQCTAANRAACTGSTPVCNTSTNTCVACSPPTPVWNGTNCVQCLTSANCSNPTPRCNSSSTCEACPAGTPVWNGTNCVQCLTSANCSNPTPRCNSSSTCEACPGGTSWNGINCVSGICGGSPTPCIAYPISCPTTACCDLGGGITGMCQIPSGGGCICAP